MSMNTNAFPNPDDIYRSSADNGLILLARANHSAPVVVLQGSLPVGAVNESREQAGLSSVVATMLTRGSAQYAFDRFNETIESVGATLTVGSDTHRTDFSLVCLSEDFSALIGVLADVLQHPTFPDEQMELVRTQRLIRIQEREQDTQSMAHLRFYEEMFDQKHPYGRSVSGYEATISTLSRKDLVAFHRERYTPRGTIIAISGDIEPEDAAHLIHEHFASWTGPEADQSVPPVPTLNSVRRVDHVIRDKVQSDIVLGCQAVPREHPDYYALRVADTILGKFGMMGRLGERVREEQGLAYYSYSTLDTELYTGTWLASAGVNPTHVEPAINSILTEFKKLGNELVPEHELADSQAYMTGTMPIGLETNGGIASILLTMEIHDLGLDYLQRYRDIIYSITPADVQRVAHQYLRPDRYVLVVAGPEV